MVDRVKRPNLATLMAIALVACLAASGAQAQGFTFGGPVSGESARTDKPDRASRKTQVRTRHCRLERHQVYDAHGQLIWRTIQVCG